MQKKTSPRRNQDRPSKKFIIGDTSALVSLQTGGLLQDALFIAQLFVPRDVEDELKLHARFDANAAAVLSLIRKGDIVSLDEARTAFDRIASKRNWLDAEIYQHAKRYLDALVD